jgi:aerotaxis receptor
MGYRVAVSKLQTEMMLVFLHELLHTGTTSAESASDLQVLFHGLVTGVERLCSSLAEIAGHLTSLWQNADKLCAELRMLGRLEINGRIEAARIANTEEVLDLFTTIGTQVITANEQLAEFAELPEHATSDDIGERMRTGLVVLERQMAKLA